MKKKKNLKNDIEIKNFSIQQYLPRNENLSKDEKIDQEKRRRYQLYNNLDYLLSLVTFFDFFSIEVINVLKNSKQISKFLNKKSVTVEDLFISIFYSSSPILELFEQYNLKKEDILNFLEKLQKKNKSASILSNISRKIKQILPFTEIEKEPDYSFEVNLLLEKTTHNAFYRFKTPVITIEILVITLLENNYNNSFILKFIKEKIGNELDWYFIKYKLIKRIHKEESKIREEVNKNQHFFAYLLKTQLTQLEFEQLLKDNLLQSAVSLFRNNLISQILEINFLEKLKKDIQNSIQLTNNRKYSK
jgi:VanZ family protein